MITDLCEALLICKSLVELFFFLFFFLWAEESDDFYEFTAEDYHRILAARKEGTYYISERNKISVLSSSFSVTKGSAHVLIDKHVYICPFAR